VKEDTSQIKYKVEEQRAVTKDIERKYSIVSSELASEKEKIFSVQQQSRMSEGKRPEHREVKDAKMKNLRELECASESLKKHFKALAETTHEKICAAAQLDSLNTKIETFQRITDQLNDRVSVLRKSLSQQQCQEKKMKSNMSLLSVDIADMQADSDQLQQDIQKVAEDHATINQA